MRPARDRREAGRLSCRFQTPAAEPGSCRRPCGAAGSWLSFCPSLQGGGIALLQALVRGPVCGARVPHSGKPVALDELRHGLAAVGKAPDARPILALALDILDQMLETEAFACVHQRPAKLAPITIVLMCDHPVDTVGEGLIVQGSAVIQVGDEDRVGHQIDKVAVCGEF